MTSLKTKRLENGAVEILDFDIKSITKEVAKEVREVLLDELVVVLRQQDTNPVYQARLCHGIGDTISPHWELTRTIDGKNLILKEQPNPWIWKENEPFPVMRVTGERKNGEYSGIFPRGKLDWHCNLNYPTNQDGVSLQGIRAVEGTRTSWINTSLAYKEMPKDLLERVKGNHATFKYNPLRWADIDNPLQKKVMLSSIKKYSMYLEQENSNGTCGIYLFSHNDCNIPNDSKLKGDLEDFLFQEKYTYHHDWQVGDIVLSDQLLTLHKRREEKDSVFEKRLLNRLTFNLSNRDRDIELYNYSLNN